MDLTLSPSEESFRDELRAWLDANHPGREPEGDDAGFAFRRNWQRKLHDAEPVLVRRNSSPAQRSSLISMRPAAGGFIAFKRVSVMIGMGSSCAPPDCRRAWVCAPNNLGERWGRKIPRL